MRTPAGARTRVRFTQDLCRLARFEPEGKVILDAGCGFGAVAIILMLMGAKEVHGIDIQESRLGTFQQMIADFGFSTLEAHLASVEQIPYSDGFFDMVLSNEAISHYKDVDAFLNESARVLKRGGKLIIADGNNGANPRIARFNYELWDRFENGPPGIIEHHHLTRPYVEARAEIVRETAPNLEEAVITQLARGTSGMVYAQIVEAVHEYLRTGEMPQSFYRRGVCPIEPYTGEVMEQHFHPAELARYIEQFGFRAQYYAYFGGAGGNPIVRLVNAIGMAISPLSVRWARAFRIVAERL
ncbi:MAG: class I SAM-dependent methyltransferase [Fimbriimonadales bacterium]|nr:class I SAM-dependent methyltransferase [Fimbriimonadales bacterium]